MFLRYDFVDSDSTIKTTEKGYVTSVGIETGGSNYRVNDRVIFEKESGTEFFSASRVSKVRGKNMQ